MALFACEYGIVYTNFIVAVVPVDPCAHCADHEAHGTQPYILSFVLDVGDEAVRLTFVFPTRPLRDHAFETLTTLIQDGQPSQHEED